MATNKHATIRYQALDKCFANTGRRYFIEDLVEACNKAIYEFSGSADGVKKRQVQVLLILALLVSNCKPIGLN